MNQANQTTEILGEIKSRQYIYIEPRYFARAALTAVGDAKQAWRKLNRRLVTDQEETMVIVQNVWLKNYRKAKQY